MTGVQTCALPISKARANLNDHQTRKINFEIPRIIAETFHSRESGNLAVSSNNLRKLESIIKGLDIKEKEIIVKMAEMDLAILESPNGEMYRKLRLLKGINSSSAAGLVMDEGVTPILNKILEWAKASHDTYQKHIGQPFEKKFNELLRR